MPWPPESVMEPAIKPSKGSKPKPAASETPTPF
ncbi:Uncharacterised protein [Vibrio cholerae]|nr:Uncharacterised protein [Vibrio cholerae]